MRSLIEFLERISKSWTWLLWSMGLVLVIATVGSLFPHRSPVLDFFASARIQGVIAILALILAAGIAKRTRLVWLCLLLLGANLYEMRLAWTDGNANVEIVQAIRLTTTNVYVGNQNHDAITAELLELDADVIAIIELTPSLAKYLTDAFSDSHPYQVLGEQANDAFGIGILSRRELLSHQIIGSPGGPRSLEVLVDDYRIIATHPYPPMNRKSFQSRNDQLRNIARRVNAKSSRDTILMGDLNCTPWSATFAAFAEQSGLRRCGLGLCFWPTWYTYPMFPFGLHIDHVMISERLSCQDYQIGEHVGSDHRSVTVTVGKRVREVTP